MADTRLIAGMGTAFTVVLQELYGIDVVTMTECSLLLTCVCDNAKKLL